MSNSPRRIKRPTLCRAADLHSRGRRSGFSFFELMAVVAIIGIMSAVAFPRIDTNAFRVNAGVRGVRATLAHAQRLAILRQHDIVVSVNVSANEIRTLSDRDNDRVVDANEKVIWAPLQEGVTMAAPPKSIRNTSVGAFYSSKPITINGMPSVIFHANGASSGDIEIYLNSPAMKPAHARAVSVTQATGRTQWYRYVTNTWRAAGE
jgi:prepilin-type N-terminal cleavage/methylation domain-containing protein